MQFLLEGINGWSWVNPTIDSSAEGKDQISWLTKIYNNQTQQWERDTNIVIEDDIESPTVYFMNSNGEVRDIRIMSEVSREDLVGTWYPIPDWGSALEQMPVGQIAAIYNNWFVLFDKDNNNVIHCSLIQCENPLSGYAHRFVGHPTTADIYRTIYEINGVGSCEDSEDALADIFEYPGIENCTFEFDASNVGTVAHIPVQPSFAFEI